MALALRLMTPEGIFWEGDCHMAVLPGDSGYVGVLENHAHAIIQMKPGTAKIYQDEMTKVTQQYFIMGGVIHISDKCDVLCEEIVTFDEMDSKSLIKKLSDLKEDLGELKEFHKIKEIQDQIQTLEVQLKSLQDQ